MKATTVAKPLAVLSALLSFVSVPGPTGSMANAIGAGVVSCNEGTCCIQSQSTCNAGGGTHTGYFYQKEGPC